MRVLFKLGLVVAVMVVLVEPSAKGLIAAIMSYSLGLAGLRLAR